MRTPKPRIPESHPTDDSSFLAILGDAGLLGFRYPGEVFEKTLLYGAALGRFHGTVLSPRHIGCAFQFAGDAQGVIAISSFEEGTADEFLRYSIVPEDRSPARARTVTTKGGTA